MSLKTITLEEYEKFLEKFSLVDIEGRRFTKMGKDFDGNYIYISNKIKFKLVPPKYVNAINYKNSLISEQKNLKQEILNIVSIAIDDNEADTNKKERYNTLKKRLKEIQEELNKIKIFFEEKQNKDNEIIKETENNINILNIELLKIYEEKKRMYNEDKEKWIELNKLYLEKKKKLEKLMTNMKSLKDKISTNYFHSYILSKQPQVSKDAKESMIEYKF